MVRGDCYGKHSRCFVRLSRYGSGAENITPSSDNTRHGKGDEDGVASAATSGNRPIPSYRQGIAGQTLSGNSANGPDRTALPLAVCGDITAAKSGPLNSLQAEQGAARRWSTEKQTIASGT